MNAVLQALFHSQQFCNEVLAVQSTSSRSHLAALQRVFVFLAFSERPAYDPAEFQRIALPPWFEHGRQQDCSELLCYLLDAMHEEERVLARHSLGTGRDDVASPDGGAEEPPGEPAESSEPTSGLVRRLLTGLIETT